MTGEFGRSPWKVLARRLLSLFRQFGGVVVFDLSSGAGRHVGYDEVSASFTDNHEIKKSIISHQISLLPPSVARDPNARPAKLGTK